MKGAEAGAQSWAGKGGGGNRKGTRGGGGMERSRADHDVVLDARLV